MPFNQMAARLLVSHQGEFMEHKVEQEASRSRNEQTKSAVPRDWEKSDWFRRWLELIRGRKTQGTAC